jgi:hypothetical protein
MREVAVDKLIIIVGVVLFVVTRLARVLAQEADEKKRRTEPDGDDAVPAPGGGDWQDWELFPAQGASRPQQPPPARQARAARAPAMATSPAERPESAAALRPREDRPSRAKRQSTASSRPRPVPEPVTGPIADASLEKTAISDPWDKPPESTRKRSIRLNAKGRQALRQAILMREVLDRPRCFDV